MAELTLKEIFLDNSLLRGVASGEHTLDAKSVNHDEYFAGFPTEDDFEEKRQYLTEVGYDFDSFVDFFPSKTVLLGVEFWLVGRYIISDAPEIDSSKVFIPEGVKISEFDDTDLAAELFARLAIIEHTSARLVLYFCVCGHEYGDHESLVLEERGQEVPCRGDGCGCERFEEDPRVIIPPAAP